MHRIRARSLRAIYKRVKSEIWITGLALFLAPSAHLPATSETSSFPESVGQGHFARVTLSNSQEKDVRLNAFGKSLPCHGDPALIECLAAVPADWPEGEEDFLIQSGGRTLLSKRVKILATKFPVEPIALTKEKKELLKDSPKKDEQIKLIRAALGTETPEKLWKGKFIKPVEGKRESLFGEKRILDGKLRPNYYHRGLDIGAPKGTPMRAGNAGRVCLTGRFIEEGNMIAIDHGRGVMSAYLHCSAINVKPGQWVKKGEIIGKIGDTGVANSPHVHFGIYIHDVPTDPLYWFEHAPD